MMASFDIFEITITGKGAHAALPHLGIDPIDGGGADRDGAADHRQPQHITRSKAPLSASPRSMAATPGTSFRIEVVLRGTARTFKPEVQDAIEAGIRRIAEGIAGRARRQRRVRYERRYPPTINSPAETETRSDDRRRDRRPGECRSRTAADHGLRGFRLHAAGEARRYIFIGNGTGEKAVGLHNPHYDFNDEILPIGASYWARLVERVLAKAA